MKSGVRNRLPDVEVLDVDIFIRGCLSLAPEKEPFLGRGLCKAHSNRKVSSKVNLRMWPTLDRTFSLRPKEIADITTAALMAAVAAAPILANRAQLQEALSLDYPRKRQGQDLNLLPCPD